MALLFTPIEIDLTLIFTIYAQCSLNPNKLYKILWIQVYQWHKINYNGKKFWAACQKKLFLEQLSLCCRNFVIFLRQVSPFYCLIFRYFSSGIALFVWLDWKRSMNGNVMQEKNEKIKTSFPRLLDDNLNEN